MRHPVTFTFTASLLVLIALQCNGDSPPAVPEQTAIQKGLAYLYQLQTKDGSWNSSGNKQAETGAVALAFISNREYWGAASAAYQSAVDRAVASLLDSASVITVASPKNGISICPGDRASCKAVYWQGTENPTYTTGLVTPALVAYAQKLGPTAVATPSGTLAGLTWGDIAQQITTALAASQNTQPGSTEGGWGQSIPGNGEADGISTQSSVIALIYNELLGVVAPKSIKDELRVWLRNVQNQSGAACLRPNSVDCDAVNTGGWLLGMAYLGFDSGAPNIQAALKSLNADWQALAGNMSGGNFGHPPAMLAVYRGLESTIGLNDTTHVSNLLADCSTIRRKLSPDSPDLVPCGWHNDYRTWLLNNQQADGSWRGYSNTTDSLATASYLYLLAATHIPIQSIQPVPNSTASTTDPARTVQPYRIIQRNQNTGVQPAAPKQQAGSGKVRPYSRKGITAVDVNPDGSALATASTDNKIRIFDATTGAQSLVLQDSLGLPTDVVFSPDGSTVNGVGRDTYLHMWDVRTGNQVAALTGNAEPIRTAAASPDGSTLATAGEETRILFWDQRGRKLSKLLFGPADFVNAVAFSPDSRLLASAGEDARVLIFDVLSGRLVFTLLGHAGPIDSVAFSPDGTMLASAGQDTVIHLWDPASGQQRRALSGHSAPIRAVSFSPDSKLLASGGEDTQIILWNVDTGNIDKVLAGSSGAINSLVFEHKGRFLASASDTGELTLWNVTSGTKMLTITVPIGH